MCQLSKRLFNSDNLGIGDISANPISQNISQGFSRISDLDSALQLSKKDQPGGTFMIDSLLQTHNHTKGVTLQTKQELEQEL